MPTTLPPQAVTFDEHVAGGPLELEVLPVVDDTVEPELVDELELVPLLDSPEPPSPLRPGLPPTDPQAMATTVKPPARATRVRTAARELFIGALLKDSTPLAAAAYGDIPGMQWQPRVTSVTVTQKSEPALEISAQCLGCSVARCKYGTAPKK